MASNGGFGSFQHLAVRFFGALDPRGPSPSEEAWALGWLLPGEQRLWRRMSGPDRRHAAGVARDVARLLGDPIPRREVMASALLHDVGKVESGIGTFTRVAVTLAAMGLGRERLVMGPDASDGDPPSDSGGLSASPSGGPCASPSPAASPSPSPSRSGSAALAARWRRRISDYLTHDRIGAELLSEAGSDPLTVAWAGEHHRPPAEWTVERRFADALKAADGD